MTSLRQSLVQFNKSSNREKFSRMLAIEKVSDLARLDVGRNIRKGLPEIVLAEGKTPTTVAKIVAAMVERTGRAIVSRATRSHYQVIRKTQNSRDYRTEFFPGAGVIITKSTSFKPTVTGGRVGILTAGTSDIPVALEAQIVSIEMGCETRTFYDVGVAGLHRLFKPLEQLLQWDADVILVIAGREGALPTVVTGMVDVPVIGVPTSKSYGYGEKGVAALAAMLQSCSLGMSVVNIDGGIGAGAVGALIANRAASQRNRRKTVSKTRTR
jgi:NCAIR mutase (PurE)-related protein